MSGLFELVYKTAVEPEATKIGPFTVWPTIFEILEGHERDLIVQFEPKNKEPGEFKEELLLTCDNCQTKKITLIGQAEKPKIEVIIDEKYKKVPEFGQLRDQFAQGQIELPTGYPGQRSKILTLKGVVVVFWSPLHTF